MNFLAFDTSSSVLNVALSSENNIIYSQSENGVRHSEMIMELTDSLLGKAGLKPSDLNGVFCMGGPGSFTGLRIGFSAAKGLALSLSIPFIAVPTLDCISYPYQDGLTLAVVESGKRSWYFAFYENGKIKGKPEEGDCLQISEKIAEFNNKKIILTGQTSDLLYNKLPANLKENISLNYVKRGYAGELISIVKKDKLLDNFNIKMFYSGPEYYKITDAEAAVLQTIK